MSWREQTAAIALVARDRENVIDRLGGKAMVSWWQDQQFWKTFAPYFFTRERVEGSAAEVEKFVTLLGIAPGASVLDLCCGIGRHSIEFARLGYRVTAVDLNKAFIAQACDRAERLGAGLVAFDFAQLRSSRTETKSTASEEVYESRVV